LLYNGDIPYNFIDLYAAQVLFREGGAMISVKYVHGLLLINGLSGSKNNPDPVYGL
jgi:hypothetical protein